MSSLDWGVTDADARASVRARGSSMDQMAAGVRGALGGPGGCHDASIRGVVCPRIRASTVCQISDVRTVRRDDQSFHDRKRPPASANTDVDGRCDLPVTPFRGRPAEHGERRSPFTICTLGHARNDHACAFTAPFSRRHLHGAAFAASPAGVAFTAVSFLCGCPARPGTRWAGPDSRPVARRPARAQPRRPSPAHGGGLSRARRPLPPSRSRRPPTSRPRPGRVEPAAPP